MYTDYGNGMGKLTARGVANLRKPGMHGDGRNLYFKVTPPKQESRNGTVSRSWVFRYMIDGRARLMGLGPYPEISLEQARAKAMEARAILRDPDNPRDPLEVRAELEAARKRARGQAVTFDKAVEAYLAANRAAWSNPKHAAQWESTLATYASPLIGSSIVRDIETADVVRVLDPIWRTKTETASRLRQRIEKVLDYATTRGLRSGDNPARWRGHLDTILPKPSKVAKVQNHPALPHSEIGGFIHELRALDGIAPLAFEFLILTATRTTETRAARWKEIDLVGKVWTIPAERMKAGKEHRVPLSDRALEIVEAMKAHKDGEDGWLFPGAKAGSSLSNGAFLSVLRMRMNRTDITPHGFRSTFRDWAGEETAFPREVIEHALAHRLKDKAEAAYQRGDLLRKRAQLMQAWADRCMRLDKTSETVMTFRGAAN